MNKRYKSQNKMSLYYSLIYHQNASSYISQLNQFRDQIYHPAFPDENEREPFDEKILPRLMERANVPTAFIVLAYEDDMLVGGEIIDWYSSCAAMEIIYLAVDEKMRGKSIGRHILQEATKIVCQTIEGQGVLVKNIFFEAENPYLTADTCFNTESRLRFFAASGAAMIPIPYYQPPLSEKQDWARNLYLCVLPFMRKDNGDISWEVGNTYIAAQTVMDFLKEFYKGLNYLEKAAAVLEDTSSLLEIIKNKEGVIPLVFFEHPRFKLYDAAIAAYYAAGDDDSQAKTADYCPVFNSYECDLMNYRHQTMENRPFTNHHRMLMEGVSIIFPASYHYSSEGSVFYRRTSRRRIFVDVSINSSFKRTKGIIPTMSHLVHLVIKPSKKGNDFFTELDFLKLVVCFGFGSKQENVSFDQLLSVDKLQIDTSLCMDIPEYLRDKYDSFEALVQKALSLRECNAMGTGISELELSTMEGPVDFHNMDEFRADILSDGPQNNDWNKTLCGIVLGIFDFGRMNGPEIFDTIRPILERKNAFALLCRGHLVNVKMDLEPERVEHILMSPYLLIPGAALAFNEDIIVRNWEIIERVAYSERVFNQSVTEKKEKKQKRKIKNELLFFDFYEQSNKLSKIIGDVSTSLTDEYLEDIFQYSSEKTILEAGSLQRGLAARKEDIMDKLANYKEKVILYRDKYTDNMDTIQNLLLFILAVMQVVTAIMHDYLLWSTTIFITVLVCVYGMRQISRKRKM